MAIVKIKLTKKVNNVVNDYYPKTSADNVVYDSNNTVADKINSIESALTAHAVTNKGSAFVSGLYKITTNSEGHVTAATPVTKSDITGLGIPDAAATQSDDGLMSAADKTKLDGITSEKIQAWDAAEQNVNADWTAESGDAQILHKPDLSIYALAANVTKSALGIDNVDNTSDVDKPISTAAQAALDNKVDKITGKGLSEANFTNAEKTKLAGIAAGAEVNVQSDWNQDDDAAVDYIKNKPANLVQDALYVHTDNNFTNAEKAKAAGAIQSAEKGAANGVAELDANGKVPSSQLPSYVDDVLSYNSASAFPATGEDGKIYIAKDTNLSYRWTGSEYGVISPSLALGNTSSTAYRGDRGASAYTHAVTNKGSAFVSGLYKITTNSEGHVTAATSVTKSDITGLGIPAQDTNTDTKVTSAANHYAPAEDASAVLSADASGSTAATWNSTSLVTGVDIKRDAKGHVVGVAVDSVKMPANPNTNTTYSAGTGLSLSGTTFSNSAPNVKSDWNAAAGTEAEILNKPTLGAAAAKDVGTGSNQVAAGNHNHAGVYAETAHTHIKELLTSRATAPYNGSFTLDGLGSSESLTDYVCIDIVAFVSTARQVVRMYRNHDGTDFFSARVILLGSTNAGLTSVSVITGVFSWGGTNKINYAGNGTTNLIVETVFGYK